MKLSMTMLSWYLRDYRPRARIEDDVMAISGIRFLPVENMQSNREYAFFVSADSVISDVQYENTYMLVHLQSYLMFMDCDYNELLNDVMAAFEYFNSWESRMLSAAADRLPLQAMLDLAGEVIGNPISSGSVDMTWRLFSHAAFPAKDDPYWNYKDEYGSHPAIETVEYRDQNGERIPELTDSPTIVQNVYGPGKPVIMLYNREGGENIGVTGILQVNAELTRMNMQMASFIARIFAKAYEFTAGDGICRPTVSTLTDCLDGRAVGKENARRLQSLLPKRWRLLTVKLLVRTDTIARQSLAGRLQNIGGIYLPVIHRDYVAALVDEACLPKINWNQYTFRDMCLGFSMPETSVEQLQVCFRQCLFVLERADSAAGAFFCERYAYGYMLDVLRGHDTAREMIHPAVKQLSACDRESGSQLLPTLKTYLDSECSQTAASAALYIHPNTLKYRLRRIREETGLALEDPDELAYLRLSVALYPEE